MQVHSSFRTAALCAAVITVCATAVHAQTVRPRSVQPAAPVAAPSASTINSFAAPKSGGLTSATAAGLTAGSGAAVTASPTNPAGLTSQAPAGLTAGSGARVSSSPVLASTAITAPGTTSTTVNNGDGTSTTTTSDAGGTTTTTTSSFNSMITDSSISANATALPGAGVAAANVARGPSQTTTMGNSGANPVEVARAFIGADTNRDGELSRAEVQRVIPRGITFEELDRNFDGIVTRSEFEDGLR